MWRKGNLLTLLVGTQGSTATLENSTEVPQKFKIKLPYDPAIALPGIDPKDTNMLIQSGSCTLMLIAALSTVANYGKRPNVH